MTGPDLPQAWRRVFADQQPLTDGEVSLQPSLTATGAEFDLLDSGTSFGRARLEPDGDTALLSWQVAEEHRAVAIRALKVLVELALSPVDGAGLEMARVEARIPTEDGVAVNVAARTGLLREGVRRDAGEGVVVAARVAEDPPLRDPSAFRGMLNSFLPRKRAIGQMLIRDHAGRVLLCELTYKPDWDLPGGVVEVNESPREAVTREIAEELALEIPAGELLLTDWLPPWSGWDDALCLVFDGGVHDAALLERVVEEVREIRAAHWCTPEQVIARARDFTARRVAAAVARAEGRPDAPAFTESGRSV